MLRIVAPLVADRPDHSNPSVSADQVEKRTAKMTAAKMALVEQSEVSQNLQEQNLVPDFDSRMTVDSTHIAGNSSTLDCQTAKHGVPCPRILMAYLWKSLMHSAQVVAEELLLPEQVAVRAAVPHTASFALRFVPPSEVQNVLLPCQKTVIEKDHADVLSGLLFLSKDPAHRHTPA